MKKEGFVPMKILAVDYGDSRTGLAACDRTEFLASPLGIIQEKSMAKTVEKNRLRHPRIRCGHGDHRSAPQYGWQRGRPRRKNAAPWPVC